MFPEPIAPLSEVEKMHPATYCPYQVVTAVVSVKVTSIETESPTLLSEADHSLLPQFVNSETDYVTKVGS